MPKNPGLMSYTYPTVPRLAEPSWPRRGKRDFASNAENSSLIFQSVKL